MCARTGNFARVAWSETVNSSSAMKQPHGRFCLRCWMSSEVDRLTCGYPLGPSIARGAAFSAFLLDDAIPPRTFPTKGEIAELKLAPVKPTGPAYTALSEWLSQHPESD